MGKTIRLISYLRMAVGTVSAFVFFGAGGLCLNFVILLVELIPAEFTEKREHMIQRMVHFTFMAYYRYLKVFRLIDGKAKRQEKLPSSAYIFVANHPTLLDIVMMYSIYYGRGHNSIEIAAYTCF